MFKDRRIRAAWISIACNFALVVLKLIGARLSLSAAMKADALHSSSDILVSGLVLLSIWITLRHVRVASQPQAREEDAGEGDAEEDEEDSAPEPPINDNATAENLTALLVSLLLIGTALGFLVSALTGYAYPLERIPAAMGIVWVCILISYFLGRYKIRVGREEGSISLEADGHHSRMDMYSSIVVFVGLLGDLVGYRQLDTIASGIVSLLVLKTGAEILYSSVRGLATSEVFSYQPLMGLRDSAVGRRVAPIYDRWFSTHVALLIERQGRLLGAALRHRRRIAVLALVVVLATYVGSGFYRIQPDEVGVVLRTGKLVEDDAQPGLHYRWPSPISKLHRVKPGTVRQLEFGYRTIGKPGEVSEPSAYLWESMHREGIYEKVEPVAIMLTGDVNEIDLNLVVEYCLADGRAAGFLFGHANLEALVRCATENAVRHTVGHRALSDVLTTARPEIEAEIFTRLQGVLDEEYDACVRVMAVHLQDVHPPVDVVPAFRRVATAREDRATSINEAQGYRNWTIPRSHGFAAQIESDAEAYTAEQELEAEGDVVYFNQLYGAYHRAPEVIAFTMYMDCLEEALPSLRKVVLSKEIGAGKGGEPLHRYFMMGEFVKKGLGGIGAQANTWYQAENGE
ncbi:MAG TPA: FtsH protease activity modulator HflK [Candidatus Hydrogenedentes bacterium]|nr:FtsH protease activity modulator HflK [Candidatus Hydrogenedentota bacterium]